jgi:hypothetical protein
MASIHVIREVITLPVLLPLLSVVESNISAPPMVSFEHGSGKVLFRASGSAIGISNEPSRSPHSFWTDLCVPICMSDGEAGSVFPTAGYANPTLTLVASAIRLADHLKA